MALKLYVLYTTATDVIVKAQYYDDATPPTPGGGQAYVVLDGEPASGFPTEATHKIVGGVVTEKSAGEKQAFIDAARKKELALKIGELDSIRAAMFARGYEIAEIDAEIATSVAEYDALP